jgi:hypothetical protein
MRFDVIRYRKVSDRPDFLTSDTCLHVSFLLTQASVCVDSGLARFSLLSSSVIICGMMSRSCLGTPALRRNDSTSDVQHFHLRYVCVRVSRLMQLGSWCFTVSRPTISVRLQSHMAVCLMVALCRSAHKRSVKKSMAPSSDESDRCAA